MTTGIGFLLLWLTNWLWVLYVVYQYTDLSDESQHDSIVENFIMNAPSEQVTLVMNVATANPYIGMLGTTLVVLAFII